VKRIASEVVASVLSAGLAGVPATAQTVYRCGNAYGPVPCPEGKAIEADDARTSAQRAEALKLAADERRRGDDMERSRLRREAAIQPALASALSLAPAPAATAAPTKKAAPKHREAKAPKGRQLAVVAFAATAPRRTRTPAAGARRRRPASARRRGHQPGRDRLGPGHDRLAKRVARSDLQHPVLGP